MHAVVQTVGVYGLGYRYTLVFDLFDKDMLRTFRQMVPRVLGLAVGQVNFLIMTYFVSGLAVGSVTILQFAYNLNSFPIGVIGVSYAIAAFPTFCEYVKNDDKEKLRDSFSATVRQVIFFAIPATVMSLLLRAQIVRLVFGAGEFDWAATIATADTLAMFAISFFAQCLVYVVIRVYFAYHDTRTPLFIGIITTATNVLGGYLLTPHFGIPGLAFAFSLATMVQLALLWALLKTKLGSLQEWALLKSALILSIAGVTSVMTTQATKYVVGDQIQLNSFLNVLTQTCAAGGVGLFTYFAMAYLLRSPEMLSFAHGLQAKFMKTSKPAETIQQNAV